jgi:hypothetical protein
VASAHVPAPAQVLPIRSRVAVSMQDRGGVPDATALDGPRDLTQMSPYRLMVRQEDNFVKIYCSHEGSLLILDSYLQQ